MNAPYKPILESTAEAQALAYYAGKIDARVAKMAKHDLADCWTRRKGEDLWVRNFTCQRDALGGRKTRFPNMLKCPEFRQEVAVEARQTFLRHDWKVDAYIQSVGRLLYRGSGEPVGSGYELRVTIKALPDAMEKSSRKVHGTCAKTSSR